MYNIRFTIFIFLSTLVQPVLAMPQPKKVLTPMEKLVEELSDEKKLGAFHRQLFLYGMCNIPQDADPDWRYLITQEYHKFLTDEDKKLLQKAKLCDHEGNVPQEVCRNLELIEDMARKIHEAKKV